jgi:Tol biopolymer transport system component
MQLSRSATKKCVTTTVFILGLFTIATLPIRAQNSGVPVAHATAVTTTAGVAVDGVLQGSDPDSGTLTFAIDTPPENGTAVITDAATGAFTYTPAPGFAGYDPFTFSVSDGASTVTATAMIFVVAVDAGMTSVVERVSVSNSGQQANQQSWGPGISADGRIVVFLSNASNLVENDTNGVTDVFVRDRQTQTTTRVSVASDGSQVTGFNGAGWVSADGRFVGFSSTASNLVPDDTNGVTDIFVHDLQTHETTRLRPGVDGAEANAALQMWGISGDGRELLILSAASNLVPNDSNGVTDVFVHDRQSGTTTRINPDGIQPNSARITPDGRYVSFGANTTNYLHDRRTGQTVAEGAFYYAGQSVDGRYVAFTSWDSLTGDTNNLGDVFVRDRHTGTVTQASVNMNGVAGNRISSAKVISADGRFVWFNTESNNLDAADQDSYDNVYRRDVRYQSTKFISVRDGGSTGGQPGTRPSAALYAGTADGRSFVAYSALDNMVATDTNGHGDIFVVSSVSYPAADAWDSTLSQWEDIGTLGLMQAVHPRRLPLTYTVLSQPAYGTLTVRDAARGEYIYMPPPDFNGTVSWTFKATTADGIDSDVGTMTMVTTPINDAPRITAHTVTPASPMIGNDVQVALQFHDVDNAEGLTAYVFWGDGAPVETVPVTAPAHTFVHKYLVAGTHQLTFRIEDGTTTTLFYYVYVTVAPLPAPSSYLRFNAAESDRVTVSNSGNVAAGPITVAAWLRTTAANTDMIAISKGTSGGEQWRLHRSRVGDSVQFTIGGTTTLVSARSLDGQGRDGLWHHYAGVWDGTTVRLFIDGYETLSVPATQTQPMRSSSDPICIGSGSSRGKCGSVPWSGDAGTAGVWNRALTPAEITALSLRQPFANQALQRAAFWQMNEGAGQMLDDAGASNRDGVLGTSTKIEAVDPAWRSGN